MILSIAAVLATAALRSHAVAVASLRVQASSAPSGPAGQFEQQADDFEPFKDNSVLDPYKPQLPSGSPYVDARSNLLQPQPRSPPRKRPFDEAFDDFYDFDQYDDQWRPTQSRKTVDSIEWAPPKRHGEFPFRGPHEGVQLGGKWGWENRMLIVPDKKFAFCYIEKNACTQFNRLVNALNGMSVANAMEDAIPFWKSNSEGKLNRYFNESLNTISKANGWKIGIFLREPAERFLSAYLSKCDGWEYGGIDCLGPKIKRLPDSEKVELFEKTVMELLPKYMAEVRAEGAYNAHYDPQHVFCGGRRLDEYDFVGELSGSPAHIQQQVVDMLKRDAGIEESDPLMDLPRELFPSQSTAGHGTGSTSLLKLFYQNRTVYDKVVELYAEDYAWAKPMFGP